MKERQQIVFIQDKKEKSDCDMLLHVQYKINQPIQFKLKIFQCHYAVVKRFTESKIQLTVYLRMGL